MFSCISPVFSLCSSFCFFNDTATTEIYTVLTHSFPTRRSSDLAPDAALAARRVKATLVGGIAVLLWALLALFTTGAAGIPPFQLLADRKEHTSELQSLMRISYAVFCLKKKTITSVMLN